MSLLPTEKTAPANDLSSFHILLWGVPKLGKSDFASRFPDVLMLATEAGLNSIPCYKTDINSWATFLAVCSELAERKNPFRFVCIDTLDNLFQFCRVHMLEKLNIQHESDAGYGKAYSLVQTEFHRVLTKLSHLGYGLIMTSHATVVEIPTRTGTVQRVVPTLPDKARKLVIGMCDLILFADIETENGPDGKPRQRRVLRTKPHQTYEAGDRTGRLPDPLPLDYAVFRQEFDKAVAAHAASLCRAKPNGNPAPTPVAQPSPAPAPQTPVPQNPPVNPTMRAQHNDPAPTASTGTVPTRKEA